MLFKLILLQKSKKKKNKLSVIKIEHCSSFVIRRNDTQKTCKDENVMSHKWVVLLKMLININLGKIYDMFKTTNICQREVKKKNNNNTKSFFF